MKKLFARLAVAFCCATAALRGQSTFTNATLNGVLTINASQIQGSSYIPPAMLGTGIPSSSTVLYGDGAWRANTQQIPSYAGLAGYVLSNTGTSLVWLNSGGLGVSLQQSFTQANSFVAGQPVVILNTGVVAPSVSSTTFSSAVAFGVIQSAGLSSTGFTVVTHGQCVVTGGTFTPGAPYYVPTSATVVTSIAPSSNGFFLTPIAIALNSTTLIVNPQTPSTIGGDITGNSFLATGTFGGSYSAGAVVDYATGNGRISVGSGAAITFYTGGVGTTAMAQLSPTGFTDYGTLTVSGSGAVNLGSGTTTVGALTSTGVVTGNNQTTLAYGTFLASSTDPSYRWFSSGGATNQKYMDAEVSNAGFRIRSFPDSLASVTTLFTVDWSGNVTGQAATINGAATLFSTLTVSGSGAVNLGSGTTTVGFGGNAMQGTFQTYKSVTGGAPQTSGSTDANQVAMISGGSVQLSIGVDASGNTWLQPRSSSSFATNYNLLLNPNGGQVLVGSGGLSVSGISTLTGAVTSSVGLTAYGAVPLQVSYSNSSGAGFNIIPSSTAGTGTQLNFANYNSSLFEPGNIQATTITFFTNGNVQALTLDIGQNLIQASGAYHQFGRAYSSGVVTATGTIDVKDSAGTVYHMLVHN